MEGSHGDHLHHGVPMASTIAQIQQRICTIGGENADGLIMGRRPGRVPGFSGAYHRTYGTPCICVWV
jgi:hypothetical protein